MHFIHYVFYPISTSSHHCIDFASSYFAMFHWCLHYILSWFCIFTFCYVSLMVALHSIVVLHLHILSCFIDICITFYCGFASSHFVMFNWCLHYILLWFASSHFIIFHWHHCGVVYFIHALFLCVLFLQNCQFILFCNFLSMQFGLS